MFSPINFFCCVPKFSGRQEDWEDSEELFWSLVKNLDRLTPVMKLQHLLNHVEGKAHRKLKGTKLIVSNFEVAWDKLTRWYDNLSIRASWHFESIIGLEPLKRWSAAELNRVLDTWNEAIQGFRDLDFPVDQWGRFLVYLVVRKLDRDTREDWEISLENSENAPTYHELTCYLEKRLQSLERLNQTVPPLINPTSPSHLVQTRKLKASPRQNPSMLNNRLRLPKNLRYLQKEANPRTILQLLNAPAAPRRII